MIRVIIQWKQDPKVGSVGLRIITSETKNKVTAERNITSETLKGLKDSFRSISQKFYRAVSLWWVEQKASNF